MFHWLDTLKWNFSIYAVIEQLFAIKQLKEVRVYYGLNNHELEKSKNFHRRLRECGAIMVTKPVKWIKKSISKELFVKYSTINQLDNDAHAKLDEFITYLQEIQLYIE